MSRLFDAMYAQGGRPSIAPEAAAGAASANALLGAIGAIADGGDRLQRAFRWLVGLNLDEAVWDATSFTKNRDRLLDAAVAKEFLAEVVEQARVRGGFQMSISPSTVRYWRHAQA
jgi:transposase